MAGTTSTDVCTIEISDAALNVMRADQLLASVPGFAIVRPRELLIGSAAETLRRRHPRQVVSGFWSRLSMDSLPVTGERAQSWADLGFAQLCAAWEQARETAPEIAAAVFAVPSGFGRERLAVLLGIAEHCPFEVAGLADAGVAALSATSLATWPVVLVDVGLHSASAVVVDVDNTGELAGRPPAEFADCGLLAVQNAWVAHIADQFIRETRYDPLHDAGSEQRLYAQLPDWQQRLRTVPNVDAEVQHGSSSHRVVLDRKALFAADQRRWRALAEHVGGTRAVVLTHRAATVAGLGEMFAQEHRRQVVELAVTASARGVATHLARIRVRPGDGGYTLTATLPAGPAAAAASEPAETAGTTETARQPAAPDPVLAPVPTSAPAAAPATSAPHTTTPTPATAATGVDRVRVPTHILVGAVAYPVNPQVLHIGRDGTSRDAERWAGAVGLPGHLCDVRQQDGRVVLANVHAGGTLVNGVRVHDSHVLAAGDVIEAGDTGVRLQAIIVRGD